MIHLYCCYTEAHKVMFQDYFVPSLTNNVLVHAYRIDLAGPGDFLSQEFIECIRRKIDLIVASIDRHRGDIIVWSDVDIILFDDFEPDVREIFAEKSDLDIVLQREGKHTSDVNSGFFAARCNDRTRRLFERVKEEMIADPSKNEQPLVNDLIFGDVDVTWEYLPFKYAARSQIWPPIEDISLYHANCTGGADGINQKKIQFSELKEFHPYEKVKVCIVTPELVGPRKNSGIGTHAFYLSRFLAALPDHEVTVLLTAHVTVERNEDEPDWKDHFKEEHGIELVLIEEQEPLYEEVGWFNQWFSLRSQAIFGWLRNKDFDICHFQDLNADGFMCMQARETGAAFQKSVFTVTVNGPNLWARQGMKHFADSPVDDALVNFCESYCLEKADMVVAPSQYALDWCRNTGWQLAEEQRVCPYIIETLEPAIPLDQPYKEANEIIFFGRLETRKGIHIFLKAIKLLHAQGKLSGIKRLHFLGGHVYELEYNSRNYIFDYLTKEAPGLPFTIDGQLDHHACIDFLREHKDALVVVPSLSETLGYTVIESLELNLNLIATKGGAIPEIFDGDDRLCEPNANALTELMAEGLTGKLPRAKMAYSRDKATQAWNDAHQHCVELLEVKKDEMLVVPGDPLISVCIPHHNYGVYLKEQLASLVSQTYNNFEVLILDDGSTDKDSLAIFDQLEKDYDGDKRIRFMRQENTGLSEARNRLAKEAKAEYIVFADADNVSEPEMLAVFSRAIQIAGADCVTCHMAKFRIDGESGERKSLDTYTPLGACVEAGPYCDPFGDANFIIRKDVFLKLGGFRHVPNTASEDWEFLAKLCLEGYKLEVIPLPLFNYREHGESNMRQTPYYDTRMRVIQPYMDRLPDAWQKRILYNTVGASELLMTQRRVGIPDKPSQELILDHRKYIQELEAFIKVSQHDLGESIKRCESIAAENRELKSKIKRIRRNPLNLLKP
ncbi:glycosyltransferase [Rubellicoccus peritrichatus]|uniref:Glycosyltransferase n=1 Tax=Rubellicoccus peritrichatus TaxID=3080537 RepID=A0AAQ3QUE3_9BACT|nr:glycosyltransferase [Puniceicoccus sp. CR14]WOO39840.1 glycosyltransferase [Puniceicoccus sp. CR14]